MSLTLVGRGPCRGADFLSGVGPGSGVGLGLGITKDMRGGISGVVKHIRDGVSSRNDGGGEGYFGG